MRRNARVRSVFWLAAVLLVAWFGVSYVVQDVYGIPLREDSFRFSRPWAAGLLASAVLAFYALAFAHRFDHRRLRISRAHALTAAPVGLRHHLVEALNAMRTVALLLISLALMGPQSIHLRDRTEVEGIDIMLTLDLSLSMQAADIAPNRFAATKHVVDEFLTRRPNDRVGAVVFGRDAYTLSPLTTDKDALRTMIDELELGMVDGRGTAIGNAVGVALNRLRKSKAKSRVLILLTDGDSNSGNLSPEQAAEFAKALGVRVFAILMGESSDAKVQQGTDIFGRPLWDRASLPVNPELLRSMAKRSGGEYFQVGDRKSLERSFHVILDRLEKSEIEDPGRVYGELFPAFVGPAIVLIVMQSLLSALALRRWP